MRILIVDDDPDLRIILRMALESWSHEVHEARDGRVAWELHRQGPFPLIICDWMMPEMNGPELCRAVRAVQSDTYTSFVILTALSGRSDFVEAFCAGADDFMTKPVDLDELNARVSVAERLVRLHQRVTHLEGLLPICAYCKKIRDDHGRWQHVERYIAARADVQFSHAVCPSCRASSATGIEN